MPSSSPADRTYLHQYLVDHYDYVKIIMITIVILISDNDDDDDDTEDDDDCNYCL